MRNVYLVCYDVGDEKRLRHTYKKMRGLRGPRFPQSKGRGPIETRFAPVAPSRDFRGRSAAAP